MCKRSPFGKQNESFWRAKGVLLDSKSSPFASEKDYFFLYPIIFDDDMITREINGNAGYIDINNRIIKEPGTHRCEITEIESLDGYKKFNQEIIAEIEVGLNDSEEKYEVKDVKNKGLFSENLKMEKEEDGNGVLIVLANDPSVKIEDVKPSGPSFLPQTGDFDIIIKIISTMLIINLIIGTTIFIYKKRK